MTDTSKHPVPIEYPGKELEATSFAINYHRWIVDEFSPFLGDTVVEVGAVLGDLSSILLESGISRLFSFEPSQNLFRGLQKNVVDQANATLVNGFFDRDSCPSQVDTVIYVNVLEHIENDLDELVTVHGVLNQEGHLLIFVPALSWLLTFPPQTISYGEVPVHNKSCGRDLEKSGSVGNGYNTTLRIHVTLPI